jgi:chromosome segregation ATPase
MDDHQPDAEAKLRQNLSLSDASKPSLAADPQRLARQAIRSQAAAREYAERQLLRAEQMIQDLSTKLHAVRHEKGVALEAARTAHTALAQTERDLRAIETALIGEKATGERAQREVQEARAIVDDLRTKLTLANQTVEALRTQLDEERQARNAAERERSAVQASAAVAEIGDAPGNQPVKRRRGRPPGKRHASAPRPAAGKSDADNQEPVQWWIKGWTPKA